jgi:hypothetical protein
MVTKVNSKMVDGNYLVAIARSLNVLDTEVIDVENTVTALDNVKYIYDSGQQILWEKPDVGTSETVDSITGDQLTTSASTYTLRKAAPYIRDNLMTNGNMRIHQRGTLFAPVGADPYTIDRWRHGTDAEVGGTTEVEVLQRSPESFLMMSVIHTGATSGGYIEQRLELDGIPFVSDFYTLSFLTDSTGDMDYSVTLELRRLTDDSVVGTASTSSTLLVEGGQDFQVRNSLTVEAPDDGGVADGIGRYVSVKINYETDGGGPLPDTDQIKITEIKLEEGTSATRFVHPPIASELVKCQRYYYKKGTTSRVYLSVVSTGSLKYSKFMFPVTMRTTPTVTIGGEVNAVGGTISVASESEDGANFFDAGDDDAQPTYFTDLVADAEL